MEDQGPLSDVRLAPLDEVARLLSVSRRTAEDPDFLRRIGLDRFKLGSLIRVDLNQLDAIVRASRELSKDSTEEDAA
jgi:hypothetical protein